MRHSEIREEDTSRLSEIWDIYRINRYKHIMVSSLFFFWNFKECYITARISFFVWFFFVIFNVRFELSKLEMTCRVKLGIIMPSRVTVQNSALGRFSTNRQHCFTLHTSQVLALTSCWRTGTVCKLMIIYQSTEKYSNFACKYVAKRQTQFTIVFKHFLGMCGKEKILACWDFFSFSMSYL